SFDPLVGEREQLVRTIEAERFRSLEVDHQLELGRLCDWQLLGLGALEDFTRVNGGLTISISNAAAVTHQTPGSGELACRVDAGNATACRQLDDLITLVSKEWIEGDQKRLGSLLDEHHECGFKLAAAAGAQDLQLAASRVCRALVV